MRPRCRLTHMLAWATTGRPITSHLVFSGVGVGEVDYAEQAGGLQIDSNAISDSDSVRVSPGQ
jgi:hypothetical protein